MAWMMLGMVCGQCSVCLDSIVRDIHINTRTNAVCATEELERCE
jgi:hypothetical protein